MYLNEHVKLIRKYSKEHKQTPLVTIIHGSQNYDLDLPNSDIDSRTFFLPTLEDIVKENKIFPAKIKDNDNGILSLNNIATFFKQLFYKNAFNDLELLFATECYFYNENFYHFWKKYIILNRDKILYINPEQTLKTFYGIMMSNYSFSEKLLNKDDKEKFWKKAYYVEYFADIIVAYLLKEKENIFILDIESTKYLKNIKKGESDYEEEEYLCYLKNFVIKVVEGLIAETDLDSLKEYFNIEIFYIKFMDLILKGELSI